MAKNYSFYEVLNSNNESDPNMFNLRQRCLIPGLYYDHLSRWLKEFNRNQLFVMQTEVFKREALIYLDKIEASFKFKNIKDVKNNLNVKQYLIDNKEFESFDELSFTDEKSMKYLQNFYKVNLFFF